MKAIRQTWVNEEGVLVNCITSYNPEFTVCGNAFDSCIEDSHLSEITAFNPKAPMCKECENIINYYKKLKL